MVTKFYKMHGCGNDYIYFNCFKSSVENPEALSIKLSDRHFGIGGDGIVLICKSDKADAKMRMFNADGSEGKMCGNAIRCVGKFLYENNICRKKELNIETKSGIKNLKLFGNCDIITSVCVNMGKPELTPEKIPVLIKKDKVIDYKVDISGAFYNITCVSMGNPHCVVFCDDIDSIDIAKTGVKFEKNKLFPEGINTEFIKIIDENTLKMRVWERGSGETLACGTGACAAAVAAVLNGFAKKDKDITVMLTGGNLNIKYTDAGVFMTGGAEMVFEGEVNV